MLIVGTKEKGEMGKFCRAMVGRGQNAERLEVSKQSVVCVCVCLVGLSVAVPERIA